MDFELIIFIAMVGVFFAGCFAFKLPVSVSMVASAIVGTLVGGYGIPVRHLVEGTFGYLDTILVIACAMIFMKVIQGIGTLDALSSVIISRYHKKPAFLLIFLMLIIMFPGMITGSSTAAVLTAGSIVAPILMLMGIPMTETASIIAMGGLLGMIAPPVNVPAMIIGGGIDMPYVGFELPLLLMTIPLAVFMVLYFGLKYAKNLDYEVLKEKIDFQTAKLYGIKIYFPVLVVLMLMILGKIFPAAFGWGMPLIFIIGSVTGLFCGRKINFYKISKEAINSALPVL
ncbi:MAG: TRAP transporter large permease subunit, partial [Clostridiaceae bacterium]|nr:TRAP transporter large permease subunit [Clostridiaceae bacterium]